MKTLLAALFILGTSSAFASEVVCGIGVNSTMEMAATQAEVGLNERLRWNGGKQAGNPTINVEKGENAWGNDEYTVTICVSLN